MKRILPLILALCLLLCGTVSADSPVAGEATTFTYDDTVVIVENNGLSIEELQHIADYLAIGEAAHDDHVSTYGLQCLFGHAINTTYATQITHNAYTTSPKCLEEKYKVEVCTRSSCDYIKKTLVYSSRIGTCHG